jgi:O-antigen ligase
MPPSPAGFLAAEKGYGVTIDLTQYDDETLANTLAAMRHQGLVWLRQPVSWAEIETAPGRFDWQELDRILAAVAEYNVANTGESGASQAKNFKLIAVLDTSPVWARPTETGPTTPPSELSHFGLFARVFAQRYGEQIDYYQVWHQPNLSANWGDSFVDPAAYADMLREATLNIQAADPKSYILSAALAATLEEGPLNLSELSYLDRLYEAQADHWFDIVAIQPYGLWTKPLDTPDLAQLNFRRAELVRQIMLNHGDIETPIWATAFGWVALPADWQSQPSPWSHDLPSVQTPRTATAIAHARQNWPWLGPMLAARWDKAGLAADDPARGFALLENPTILEVIATAAENDSTATPGYYPATHPSGVYSPGWRFALGQADIPRQPPRTLTISFEGTRLDLTLDRGDFRGYLWVTIDGQPARQLPQDGRGQSYVILYDPLRERATVTLAQHLPAGRHEAVIEADGGWDQWVLEGWTVMNEVDSRFVQAGLASAGLVAALSGVSLLGQIIWASAKIAKLLWAWGEILTALYAILGERGQLFLSFGLAISLYFSQGWLALALLSLLAISIFLRPDVGLALTTLALFFFHIPIRLPLGSFSPVELALTLTLIGFIFRGLLFLGRTLYIPVDTPSQSPSPELPGSGNLPIPQSPNLPWTALWSQGRLSPSSTLYPLSSTDWATLTLVLLALLATFTAEHFNVSLREWRVVVLEPAIFYFLVRLGSDFSPPATPTHPLRWVWRLIDAFVAGATLQAILALYLYFFTDRSIDAEGVHRALGLGYGSPNNLALMLGRAWPIVLVVAALDHRSIQRRGLYGVSLLLVSLALYLSFSKGALLLGLPAGLLAMILLYGLCSGGDYRRRTLAATVGGLILLTLALIPFSQTERFRTTFDFSDGSTGFFRLKLWQASWAMLRDHWVVGVGPDNFLYHYRSRYILPEAWQEPNLSHPHNWFLDFGTRLGLGGIGVFLWLQVAFWRKAWPLFKRQGDPLVLGLMGSMVIVLSHGLVDNSYFLVDLAFAFFLMVGVVQRWGEVE